MSVVDGLLKKPWFHGLLPREDVRMLLKKNGDYLVRTSEPVAGKARHLIISVMQNEEDNDGARHYVVKEEGGKLSVFENQTFKSVVSMLTYYKTNLINEKDKTSLLINAVNRQFWELSHEDIQLTKVLGEGAFGEVKAGTLETKSGKVNVAVKVAKLEKCTKEQIKEIMAEARLMRNFDHKHVVRCYGVAACTEPLLVVMELVKGGGLDSYLQKNKVSMEEKGHIMWQVAQGLDYIHKQTVIHRDIAARNCLYGAQIAKVSDFGLSRAGPTYQMDPSRKVPIRWLAPETLATFIYSQKSDVFAFGILCWEVIENGEQPYPGMTVLEVHSKVLKEDYRMTVSDKLPSEMQDVIKKCWQTGAHDRPSMEQCVGIIEKYTKKNPIQSADGILEVKAETPNQNKSQANTPESKSKVKSIAKFGRNKKMKIKVRDPLAVAKKNSKMMSPSPAPAK